ncbi:CHASE2 domain-containing protein [Shumkonia mesophila]|uniref:CHASE2 domain-containing protein n=1 Tax=Shumkonia mesophila TaxID=2838854 RepID=UPI002934939C|nr:adenylate/guanylate cyclase domain-containing protein [Shumkonia mesophila]
MIGLGLLGALLAFFLSNPYPLQLAQTKTFDLYQRMSPRTVPPPESKPVTIIDLDEDSLSEVGQWPWPRNVIARLVSNLTQMGAVLVAFDMVFPEADRMNPLTIADSIAGLDEETRERLRGLPGNDALFADVIKRGRVVLGQAGFRGEKADATPPVRKSIALKGPKPHQFVENFRSLVRNVPVIEKAALGHGIFSLASEPDGIVRRVPTIFAHQGELYPSLPIEMLRVLFQRPTLLVETNEAGVTSIGIASKSVFPPNGLKLGTDSKGRVWPYFSKRDRAKYVSAREVLTGTADPALIRGKLTIIGTSAVGLLDIRSTPTEEIMPGVEVHAQLIEAVLTGNFLSRPNNINGAEAALVLIGGLLIIWLVPAVGARWTLLLFLVIAGSALGTSWYLFAERKILFDAGFAVASMLVLYVLLTYTGYAREEAGRRQVRNAFAHYLSPAMVEKLAENPSQLSLGGEKRDMTMLFCDVRGFTTISEQFDAEGLTRLINKLLTPLTDIILNRQGTVDKYMGDCIMAFWNAPLDDAEHARHACLAALAMNAEMVPLNQRLEAEAQAEGRPHLPLKIGIGINSGDVVVGNMGSDQRFDYSVLGDHVNLASRLEGQSKTYGVDIIIGDNTWRKAPDLAVLELDLIKVKGKTAAVRVHTLLGDEAVCESEVFRALSGRHSAMLEAYRGQRWQEALAQIDGCRKLCDGHNLGGVYDLYEARVREYEANPPCPGWDGVFTAMSK